MRREELEVSLGGGRREEREISLAGGRRVR